MRSASASFRKAGALKARIITVAPPTRIISATTATSPVTWVAGTASTDRSRPSMVSAMWST